MTAIVDRSRRRERSGAPLDPDRSRGRGLMRVRGARSRTGAVLPVDGFQVSGRAPGDAGDDPDRGPARPPARRAGVTTARG